MTNLKTLIKTLETALMDILELETAHDISFETRTRWMDAITTIRSQATSIKNRRAEPDSHLGAVRE